MARKVFQYPAPLNLCHTDFLSLSFSFSLAYAHTCPYTRSDTHTYQHTHKRTHAHTHQQPPDFIIRNTSSIFQTLRSDLWPFKNKIALLWNFFFFLPLRTQKKLTKSKKKTLENQIEGVFGCSTVTASRCDVFFAANCTLHPYIYPNTLMMWISR